MDRTRRWRETTRQMMIVKWLFYYRLDRIHGGLHDIDADLYCVHDSHDFHNRNRVWQFWFGAQIINHLPAHWIRILSPCYDGVARFSNKAIFGTTEGIEERKVPCRGRCCRRDIEKLGGWYTQSSKRWIYCNIILYNIYILQKEQSLCFLEALQNIHFGQLRITFSSPFCVEGVGPSIITLL